MNLSDLQVRITGDIKDLSQALGQGAKKLDNFSRNAEKSVDRVTRGFTSLKTAIGGALAIGAVVKGFQMMDAALTKLDKLGDVADKIGITSEKLQELQYAAEQTGVPITALNMGLQRFTRRVAEAQKGKGELKETLKLFNIALVDEQGYLRSSTAIFDDYANAIQNAKTKDEQLLLAFKGFDSEGAALVNTLREGTTGLEKFAKEARDLGLIIDNDMVASAGEAKDKLNTLKTFIEVQFTSAIAENADAIGEWSTDMIGALNSVMKHSEEIKTGMKVLAGVMGLVWGVKTINAVTTFIKLMRDFNLVTKTQVGLQIALQALQGPKGWLVLAGAAVATTAAVTALNAALDDNIETTNNLSDSNKGPSFMEGYTAAIQNLQRALAEGRITQDEFAASVERLDAARKKTLGGTTEAPAPIAGGVTPEATSADQAEADRIKQRNRTIEEIYQEGVESIKRLLDLKVLNQEDFNREMERLEQERTDSKKAIADAEFKAGVEDLEAGMKEIEATLKAAQERNKLRQEEYDALVKTREEWLGIIDPIRLYDEAIADLIVRMREYGATEEDIAKVKEQTDKNRLAQFGTSTAQMVSSWGDMTKNMDDATSSMLDNFANELTNALTTGQANFGDFAQSIIKMITAMIVKMMIFKAISTLFPGMMGGAPATATPGLAVTPVGGQAGGGLLGSNKATWVGERGPELVIPQGPSRVLNNHVASSMAGTGGQNIKVEVINRGTPQRAAGSEMRADPKGMIVSVIMEDLQRNGQIANGLGSTYGLRRRS